MDVVLENDGKSLVEHKQVLEAVSALLAYIEKKSMKKQLLSDNEKIWLQFTFKKVPQLENKFIKLILPHSLASESASVCLFVKDLDKKDREYEKSVHHFKEYLESKGVKIIPDIIPIKSLRLEYKPYEAKKNLSNMYDIYLADSRIVRFLPSLLGKNFYGRKRIPIQVNMNSPDLKTEMNSAICNSRCMISGKGSSSNCYVAKTSMKRKEIADNVCLAVEQIVRNIPGGHKNIRNFYIKSENSLAVPIYISLGSSDEVVLPVIEKEEEKLEPEEISTLVDHKVIISKCGTVRVVPDSGYEPKKGRKNISGDKRKFKTNDTKSEHKKLKTEKPKDTSSGTKKNMEKKKKVPSSHKKKVRGKGKTLKAN